MQKPGRSLLKKNRRPPMVFKEALPSMHTNFDGQNVPEVPHDRRRHPRYRLSVPLTIHSADGAVTRGISVEISTSGLSAIVAEPLQLDDTVELEPISAVNILALVKRRIGKIYGFEFLELTAEQTRRIVDLCKSLPRYRGKSLGI
jgi:PilZ domain-containing protein